jgi:hypothetical protein
VWFSRDSTAAGRAAYARPDRTADAHTMDARRDRCHPIRPGAATPDIIKLTQLTNEFTHLRLTGRHRDALGQPIAVDERVEIREWWRAIQAAHHLAPPDYARDTAQELEKLRRLFEGLVREATRVRRVMEHEDE